MVATIIVPLDGSELAEKSLPYARGLASREGASVVFVSAVEIPTEFSAIPVGGVGLGEELDQWVGDRRQYLETVAKTFGDVSARFVVSVGAPGDVVIEAIEAEKDPLVVMASHGRSGLSRLFAGSVASRILREVHCPILLIRANLPEQPAGSTVPFSKALVPLDGSEFGEYALNQALRAIDNTSVALHLLRVVDIPAMTMASAGDPSMAMNYGLVSEYLDATRDEAKEYLAELVARLTAEGRTVTWEVRDGDVARTIGDVAGEQKVDLIVMSTHGRGGLGRLIFGSVAERVLHEAMHPLLLIRPTEPKE